MIVYFWELQLFRQTSVAIRKGPKLSSKFYELHQVIKKIGNAAYELQLPPDAKIHLVFQVFHVSQLKKKIGAAVIPAIDPPICTPDGIPMVEPITIIGRTMIRRNNKIMD